MQVSFALLGADSGSLLWSLGDSKDPLNFSSRVLLCSLPLQFLSFVFGRQLYL